MLKVFEEARISKLQVPGVKDAYYVVGEQGVAYIYVNMQNVYVVISEKDNLVAEIKNCPVIVNYFPQKEIT